MTTHEENESRSILYLGRTLEKMQRDITLLLEGVQSMQAALHQRAVMDEEIAYLKEWSVEGSYDGAVMCTHVCGQIDYIAEGPETEYMSTAVERLLKLRKMHTCTWKKEKK